MRRIRTTYHWPSRAVRSRPALWPSVRRAPPRKPTRRPPATSTSRPSRAGSIIPGRSPSCRTAACWSPSGRGACASSARTASFRRRSPACRRSRASGQGGLLDVVLDRDYAQNQTIYFCYADPVNGGGRTALARARLIDEGAPRLDDVKVIFRQDGPLSRGMHFGCRIVQTPDDNLFLTMGEHFGLSATKRRTSATISARSCASGPTARCRPTIRSSASRARSRRSGATAIATRRARRCIRRPASCGRHEHGPRGGDEVNIPLAGKNYGWPVIGYGIDYSGAKIHESTHKAGMEQPVKYWVPSIATSGMTFYTGDLFPAWHGNLFVGALGRAVAGAARARRREGRQGGAAAAAVSASASATCGRGRTARSSW